MTQNVIKLPTDHGLVRICIGWDRPLSEFFCNAEPLDHDDESDEWPFFLPPTFPGGLSQIRESLQACGLVLPEIMFEKTQQDGDLNAGNIYREFSPTGTILVDHGSSQPK